MSFFDVKVKRICNFSPLNNDTPVTHAAAAIETKSRDAKKRLKPVLWWRPTEAATTRG